MADFDWLHEAIDRAYEVVDAQNEDSNSRLETND